MPEVRQTFSRAQADKETHGTDGAEKYDGKCPHCGRQLILPDIALGRVVTCPACEEKFRTPKELPAHEA